MKMSNKTKTKSKTLVIRGIPDEFTLDDISDFVEDQLEVETALIELRKTDRYKFRGSIIVAPSTRKEADRLLNEKFTCEDQVLQIKEITDSSLNSIKVNQQRKERPGEKKKELKVKKLDRKKEAILHFTGRKEDSTFEEFKRVFRAYESVAWVAFVKDKTEGYIRFTEDGGARKVAEKAKENDGGKIVVDEAELEVRVVSGEEEEDFWQKTEKEIARRNQRRRTRWNNRGWRFNQRLRKPSEEKGNTEDLTGPQHSEDNTDKHSEMTDSSPEKTVHVDQIE